MLARAVSCVIAVTVLLSLVSGCRGPDKGTVEASIDVGGRTRTYLYHLPPETSAPAPAADATGRPLVIALHGRGGNAVHTEDESRFSALADREGFVVAYPNGVDRSWHDRRESGPAAEQHVDDVGFISALIDKLVADGHVDPKRVYVTGASNGGMMTFRLACELSAKIAAVAPVIGLLPETEADECKPVHAMPIAIFVGTEDPLVPYGGGEVANDRGRVLSADATRAKFAELASCEPIDVETTTDNDKDDGTRILETAHTKCKGGAEVRLFSIDGGGHTWPNGTQYLPKVVIGRVTREIDGAEEMWKFFGRHTLTTPAN